MRDSRGFGDRGRLLGKLVRGRRSAGTQRLRLRDFDLEVRLSQGELAPYAQLLRDRRGGVLPAAGEVEGWTILDCGANVGLFSLFLGRARRIVAVEPNPDTYGRLKRNLERNELRAVAVESAISDEVGMVRMSLSGEPSVLGKVSPEGELEVPATTIDRLLGDHGIERVDLLKLDVEGHEIEALEGARESLAAGAIERIVAEFDGEDALARLDAHLRGHGLTRSRTGDFNALYVRESPAPAPAAP